mmetsp:Transcript_8195/g.11912  ORF Transcript_8195/g.11912 Transcript_8195/m.11912 type:complete len:468 (+) Transcript_8195:140-1543(+)
MSYKLKTIRYKNEERFILLQNENGPCPLLAAANVLILRGSIELPKECIHTGAASLDHVCNVLCDHVLKFTNADDHSQSFQLQELLDLFPTLQDGMDINPKLTEGPEGYEYTTQMSSFDLLRIRLVHGWLLDPSEQELYGAVKNCTYNQLLDLVLKGQEAGSKLTELEAKLTELKKEQMQQSTASNDKDTTNSNDDLGVKCDVDNVKSQNTIKPKADQQTIDQLKQTIQSTSEQATKGSLINEFLLSTSHQLTQYGLEQLYQLDEEDDKLWVFFRNNHFGTLAKHSDEHLYLLVTDLGYSSVPEIVWEKLDVIDGNTQYFTQEFTPSRVMGHLEGGRMPENLETYLESHPNPREATDYLLALAMNDGKQDDLIAAATKASLEDQGGTIAAIDDVPSPALLQETYARMARQHNDAASEALAKQLQQTMNSDEDASLLLAQRMQNEEYQRETRRGTPSSQQAQTSSCVIS